MNMRNRPTAVYFADPMLGVGAVKKAQQMGVRIPDELSVVGFDDEAAASRTSPPLTTIHQPLREMGAAGVERLLARIDDPDLPAERRVLPIRLVVRGSTGPAPRQP